MKTKALIKSKLFSNLNFTFTYTNLGDDKVKFSDSFFDRVEKKSGVGKQTILDLATKLQQNDLKNEKTLREVISELSKLTGRNLSKEKEDKIVETVINDKVPKDIDKMI